MQIEYLVDYEDKKAYHKDKLVFSYFTTLAQKRGRNLNTGVFEYQFEASLVSLTGTGRSMIEGSLQVDSNTKNFSAVICAWYQLVQNRGPGTTKRNMKKCNRRNVIETLLKKMALHVHADLNPSGPPAEPQPGPTTEPASGPSAKPLPITFTPDGEDEIPSFLRRK
jgi:hypothetical protein